MRWYDNHCHLQLSEHDNLESEGPEASVVDALVADAAGLGVERMVTVGVDIDSSVAARSIAQRFDGVKATAGIHPHEADDGSHGLGELLASGAFAAVGECGLDYHYLHSAAEAQRSVFAEHIALAHRFDLPLVVHTREAWDDTLAILDSEGVPKVAVLHCFTGGPAEAEACLERGMYLSFSGIVTFPSATDVAEAAKRCPDDRLLVETDSPYLAPVPHRGRRNVPAHVVHVGTRLAELRGQPVDHVARTTWDNATRIYG